MALAEKYQAVIALAQQHGNVSVDDSGDVLHISGTVNDDAAKQAVWDEYNKVDPGMGSGDLTLDLQVAEGGGGGGAAEYTVQAGDSLSKIASHHGGGLTWQDIYEANKDTISNPDMIHPGQKLKIPTKS
jgi:nucleoid-associated protein YgaU